MVRLSDLHPAEADHMRARAAAMEAIDPGPWLVAPPLGEATVAVVSTAGFHRRSDAPFQPGAIDYRLIPGDVDFADVVVSHVSTNFDRSAFQQDPNIWLPLIAFGRWRPMVRSVASPAGTTRSWGPSRTTGPSPRPVKRWAGCSPRMASTSLSSYRFDRSARARSAPWPTTSSVRAWPPPRSA